MDKLMAAQQAWPFPAGKVAQEERDQDQAPALRFLLLKGFSAIGYHATTMLGKLSLEEPIAEPMADSLPSPSGAGIGAETPSQSKTTERPKGRPRTKKEKEKRPRGRPRKNRRNRLLRMRPRLAPWGSGLGFKAISLNIWGNSMRFRCEFCFRHFGMGCRPKDKTKKRKPRYPSAAAAA